MDPVHERGSMDPVHILMDLVHGPGPQRGSMFCTFPQIRHRDIHFHGEIFRKKENISTFKNQTSLKLPQFDTNNLKKFIF